MANCDFEKDILGSLLNSLSRLQTVYDTDLNVCEVVADPNSKVKVKQVKHSVIKLTDLKESENEPLLHFGNDYISVCFGEKKPEKLRDAFTSLYIEGKHIMNILETLNELNEGDATTAILPGVHTGSKQPKPIKTCENAGKSKSKQPGANTELDKSSKERDLEIDRLRNEIASLNVQLKQEEEKLKNQERKSNEKEAKLEREISLLNTLEKGTKAALISDITRSIGRDITRDELFQELMDKNSNMIDRYA